MSIDSVYKVVLPLVAGSVLTALACGSDAEPTASEAEPTGYTATIEMEKGEVSSSSYSPTMPRRR